MAQSVPPVRQASFGGVSTGGNVFRRPPDTAVRCHNLRPMPGGALRLRGGWNWRPLLAPIASTEVHMQFHEFRKGTFGTGIYHIVQILDTVSGVRRWSVLDLPTWAETVLEAVTDPQPLTNGHLAITTVRDRVYVDNGLGWRVASVTFSIPALSSWDGTQLRYVGLDSLIGVGTANAVTVELNAAAGNNTITKGMSIWVGLHNSATNHYGNGTNAYSPTLASYRLAPGASKSIIVDNLNRLNQQVHDLAEQAELFYVFYATLDGFYTPYLILNAAGTDVFKVPVVAGGFQPPVNLSLTAADPKGFFVSQAHEMPRDNFPPRPMADICYQNGRVYYILRSGGAGVTQEFGTFSYITGDDDAAAVGWSAAADDLTEIEFVGQPEESFPLQNRKYVPSGERPMKVADLANRGQVLVLTATHTYWLEEISTGLHVFQRISENRGLLDKRTYCRTPRGPMWVTQDLEIVILHEDSMTLEVLSEDYAELLHASQYTGATFGVAADYLLDPQNMIDRYQVWASNGYSVIHDFALERDQQRRSVTIAPAWTATAFPVTGAASVRDATGKRYHLAAKKEIWTQEAQPNNGLVPVYDIVNPGTIVEIAGDYIGQWLDFGDPLLRKEITEIFVTGDAEYSEQLLRRPLIVMWYSDLWNAIAAVTDNILALEKLDQSVTDQVFIGKIDSPHMRWLKYRCQMTGHNNDAPTVYFPTATTATAELDLSTQTYGMLAALAITVNASGANR